MTHEDLRKRAVRWLTNTKHCGVVLSEIVSACSEIPDAVGWHGHFSYSVECKVSRSDFLRNGDKIHSRTGRGVGQLRYFLVHTACFRSAGCRTCARWPPPITLSGIASFRR